MTDLEAIARPKLTLRSPIWTPRSNHAGHLIATADLIDDSFATIPGLTVQFEVKAPVVVDSCLYLFSIMRLRSNSPRSPQRRPILQLEVAPYAKRTHNGTPPIYGPHLHVADDEPVAVDVAAVHCGGWSTSLQWFLQRANIQPFALEDPEHVQL